ncbi:MAG: hypothetical protein ACREM9_10865 [Gemmatimonadales bacterium]
MRQPQSITRRTRHRRSRPALGLAALVLTACAKTPDPPGTCSIVGVELDWSQFHAIPLQSNFDSLRSLVAGAKEDGARAHLVQEYVFAANRLDPPARRAALASVSKVLEQSRRQ